MDWIDLINEWHRPELRATTEQLNLYAGFEIHDLKWGAFRIFLYIRKALISGEEKGPTETHIRWAGGGMVRDNEYAIFNG